MAGKGSYITTHRHLDFSFLRLLTAVAISIASRSRATPFTFVHRPIKSSFSSTKNQQSAHLYTTSTMSFHPFGPAPRQEFGRPGWAFAYQPPMGINGPLSLGQTLRYGLDHIGRRWVPFPRPPAADPHRLFFDNVPSWMLLLDQKKLPAEIKVQIMQGAVSDTKCCLERLTPEWHICNRGLDWQLELELRSKRVDVYTVPEHVNERDIITDKKDDDYDEEKDCPVRRGEGHLRQTWDHMEDDHDWATFFREDPRRFPEKREGAGEKFGHRDALVKEWVNYAVVELKYPMPGIWGEDKFEELWDSNEQKVKRRPWFRTHKNVRLARYFDDVVDGDKVLTYLGEEKDRFPDREEELQGPVLGGGGEGLDPASLFRARGRGSGRPQYPDYSDKGKRVMRAPSHSPPREVSGYRQRDYSDAFRLGDLGYPRDNGVGNNPIFGPWKSPAKDKQPETPQRIVKKPKVQERRYLFSRIRHLSIITHPLRGSVGLASLLGVDWVHELKNSDYYKNAANKDAFDKRYRKIARWLMKERTNQFKLLWHKMPRLEEVYLDLRGMTIPCSLATPPGYEDTFRMRGYYSVEFVANLAKTMSGRGLRRLTIAGLRSYTGDQGYDAWSCRDKLNIKRDITAGSWDENRFYFINEIFAGERDEDRMPVKTQMVNWWMMFVTAVRPGGKLVFVDREYDNEARTISHQPKVHIPSFEDFWPDGDPGNDDWGPKE
ncbi:hypothetical protein B0T21DRAFT_370384 [Apiosordaria backusii]|uniref:Uncharacterized protein n=1 Tax=Apiosordaria backusii TaxID=314023 RepID=A0AA40B7J4_9PEZI|nr:hypothetical protein B0T21DRAFT_370384 [Apiosordaria backusii]